ncbi:MAG: hypothetical protein QOK25_1754 [Thermoleophilaceae bacterium]|jgi:membrane-associated phospholipid phosphatase|nr:hypothetical protein [Thermoleophilaceae bacterium]
MSMSRLFTRISLLAVAACAAVYVVAVGTSWGHRLDAAAIPRGTSGPEWERAHAALRHAVDTIHVATIALAVCAAVLVALRRRRPDLAVVALATIAGANLTTHVLKPLLAHTDPFGGEGARSIAAAFPSGHATAAMSLALVAVIVAPRRWRGWVSLAAAGYAAAVGVGLIVRVDHFPSDVVGGFLVAAAWAASTSAVALSHRQDERNVIVPPLPRPKRRTLVAWAALTAAAVALAAIVLREPPAHLHRGLFAVAALVIASLALLLPVGLSAVLARGRRYRA